MISIIVPCFNEENIIEKFVLELSNTIDNINKDFELIFIDNSSSDQTFSKLNILKDKFNKLKIIKFSNYFGKEAAILAGLDKCSGESAIIMDPDLEDPPNLIPELIDKWENGYEVVLTKRRSEELSILKKVLKNIFYKILIFSSQDGKKIQDNSGDFRLIDKKVINHLKSMRERTRFLRGLVNYIGFSQTVVEFDRPFRKKGKSKSSYSFLYKYAFDSLFSFSNVPIALVTKFGFMLLLFILAFGIFLIFQKLLGKPIEGFTTVLLLIGLTSSFNIIAIGLVGEYVSRIYIEVKNRPIYIISEILEKN